MLWTFWRTSWNRWRKPTIQCCSRTHPKLRKKYPMSVPTNSEKRQSKTHQPPVIENLPGQWCLSPMVSIAFTLCSFLYSDKVYSKTFSALRMLIELCSPVDLELIEMSQALNRIVGEEVVATVALPPFPASIKDGYAVH